MKRREVRQVTNQLYGLAEQGVLTWQAIGEACLAYMSERDVADMARANELIRTEEEPEEPDDEASEDAEEEE